MIRIILFLFLVGVVALGAAVIADQTGDVTLSWNAWRIDTSLPVLVLALVLIVFAAMLVWAIIRSFLNAPERLRRLRRERRHAKGRNAITQGLIAIGTGDHFAARRHADVARRLAHQDPLAMLLHAQSAQLDGDREGAQRAFHAMAERKDTRLLGLRGLFVEAQRRDDAYAAVALAEEALKTAPASAWASHAVLGFRCSKGDWDGALKILENNLAAGLIDPAPYKRQRGVLLTARALDLETSDRDRARASITEAVKLAPTLVPAATLAAKFLSENNQTRRAMQVIETAWTAQPHPDLADAYAHVRLGDSAVQRLARVEKLAARSPGNIEGALAVARAAIDSSDFARAREALAPFIEAPTQRVAILMAELERAEHGDGGSARVWMQRAVRAALDPAWTADGYVSEHWRPVSPVTGRLDAFQWLTPVAALPSEKAPVLEAEVADEPALPLEAGPAVKLPPPAVPLQDNEPAPVPSAPAPVEQAAPPPAAPVIANVPPPVFRPRREIEKPDSPRIPAVIPIVRAPDDPGVADEARDEEFDDPVQPEPAQRGGWKGFLSRLVS
ncbi:MULTISPECIES: heme biosynthesis HemY N-terminal domain-containing protein [unclassified Afipia]|uniref:heme biosynthesis protein HemY n=1 Tax=unclassified Afipia TaxID=2642050 RepID=UPI000464530C|nr:MULTISPECIES: heme biosynthesis HemY N-terminal domain-containing protein [unclassified Afipia]HAP48478.1 heme biosynthesis protein HemY [Afipia sp.]